MLLNQFTRTLVQLFELYYVMTRAVLSTLARRRMYGPRNQGWPLWFEILREMMQQGLSDDAALQAEDIRGPLDLLTALPSRLKVHIQPVSAGGVSAEWFCGEASNDQRVILYLHGGGYVSGSTKTHRVLLSKLAREAQARLLAVDYRLAPEHPYPAAVEDAWAVYWWLITEHVQPQQIVIAGDSAGGGLTIALLVALREAGMPLPAAAVCLSPWADLAMRGSTLHSNVGTDYLNEMVLRRSAEMYLDGIDAYTPLASPIYADLDGLPPLLIQAGAAEMLLDDARRLAQRAEDAGVEVELEIWENMIHVWQFLYKVSPEAKGAVDSVTRFIREHVPVNNALSL